MSKTARTIEVRVADLEREVTSLMNSRIERAVKSGNVSTGFGEEGQPGLTTAPFGGSTEASLEERVARLEKDVAGLKGVLAVKNPANAWILDELGAFESNLGFEEAVRLGRAYRRRQPKC